MPDDKKMIGPNPGPYIALPSVEDDAAMKRALKGATTSRSAGMAHVALEKMNYGKSHKTLDR